MRVAIRCQDFEVAIARDLEHRDIECAATEVVDDHLLFLLFVKTVRKRGCGRLIDDTNDFETGNFSGFLRRLALVVIEVRGHSDDCLAHSLTEVRLGVFLQFHEHLGAHFLRKHILAICHNRRAAFLACFDIKRHVVGIFLYLVETVSDETLRGKDCILRIGHCLALRCDTHEDFRIFERYDRWRRIGTFAIRDHLRLAAFDDCHAGVGCAEVDTDNLGHAGMGKLALTIVECQSCLVNSELLYTAIMFLDAATITVAGGKGGDGCVAWRREKYVDKGGPDGGDGGDGGHVIIRADDNTDTLSVYASRKRFSAQEGERGRGKNCAGARGNDTILLVPPGTIVREIRADGSSLLRKDLRSNGDDVIVAKGGRGGYGNTHFVTSTRQAPDFAELGEPGEKRTVSLELKLVADVGIIGYPSVGKSSLIAAVSRARPKIADYPFTTLVPNLGVVKVADREFVLCDVPGLIEGASEGKGLGHQFLKHIERCGLLLHVLDVERPDIVQDYRAIRHELQRYSPSLAAKKELVVLNKIDLIHGDTAGWKDELRKAKIPLFAEISAATRTGTEGLMKALLPLILEERNKREIDEQTEEDAKKNELQVLQPHIESEKMGAYDIRREGAIVRVSGKRIEQFTVMTNFTNPSARQRFRDVCERIGLLRALEKVATPDDAIWIGAKRVDEYLR